MTAAGTVQQQAIINPNASPLVGLLTGIDGQFGQSLTAIGDLNGDLVPDLAITIWSNGPGGVVLAFLTATGTVMQNPILISDPFATNGVGSGSGFGVSIASIFSGSSTNLVGLAVGAHLGNSAQNEGGSVSLYLVTSSRELTLGQTLNSSLVQSVNPSSLHFGQAVSVASLLFPGEPFGRYDFLISSPASSEVFAIGFDFACGDGAVGQEECDDGNNIAGDGCSPICQQERGWDCSNGDTTVSVCTPLCGDGFLVGNEICDDGNTISNDGCSSACQTETGFDCVLGISICSEICGDRLVVGQEQCDDGNNESNDGCNEQCFNEASSNTVLISSVAATLGSLCLLSIYCLAAGIAILLRFKARTNFRDAQRIALKEGSLPLLESVLIGQPIGSGNFGQVFLGTWHGKKVALKTLSGNDISGFENELKIMSGMRHPDVLSFYGIFYQDEKIFMVTGIIFTPESILLSPNRHHSKFFNLTEYMDQGDLLTLLHHEGQLKNSKLMDM